MEKLFRLRNVWNLEIRIWDLEFGILERNRRNGRKRKDFVECCGRHIGSKMIDNNKEPRMDGIYQERNHYRKLRLET